MICESEKQKVTSNTKSVMSSKTKMEPTPNQASLPFIIGR